MKQMKEHQTPARGGETIQLEPIVLNNKLAESQTAQAMIEDKEKVDISYQSINFTERLKEADQQLPHLRDSVQL